ncbi:hypothetical protein MKZ38_008052 [Zalerion maritima]|uniref:Uncharacterized protein n=1 Tax=Zalerion maritima TaxID=339359 RepID=A0AAD5RID8_9PEZI|nr:hypothetical protein MKZ38_008052 [Zalerion maritima]
MSVPNGHRDNTNGHHRRHRRSRHAPHDHQYVGHNPLGYNPGDGYWTSVQYMTVSPLVVGDHENAEVEQDNQPSFSPAPSRQSSGDSWSQHAEPGSPVRSPPLQPGSFGSGQRSSAPAYQTGDNSGSSPGANQYTTAASLNSAIENVGAWDPSSASARHLNGEFDSLHPQSDGPSPLYPPYPTLETGGLITYANASREGEIYESEGYTPESNTIASETGTEGWNGGLEGQVLAESATGHESLDSEQTAQNNSGRTRRRMRRMRQEATQSFVRNPDRYANPPDAQNVPEELRPYQHGGSSQHGSGHRRG